MTTNHIDQLAQWWDEAEIPNANTLPRDGDRIIIRYNSEWYEIATADGDADESDVCSNTRILSRAPKPNPAWHDAVAVIAGTRDFGYPRVFVKDDDGFWNDALAGRGYFPDELLDVTPLIEQKVTDEMVKRAIDKAEALGYIERVFGEIDGIDHNAMAEIVTAALGLETA